MLSLSIGVVRWSARQWLGRLRSQKTTMLPIDYASALDWRRGQQSNRSKISGMYRHHIVDHGLGNADQPATQLKKKVLLEAKCGSSASSMMREEMKLYLIENTLAIHLEDETSQTKIRA